MTVTPKSTGGVALAKSGHTVGTMNMARDCNGSEGAMSIKIIHVENTDMLANDTGVIHRKKKGGTEYKHLLVFRIVLEMHSVSGLVL